MTHQQLTFDLPEYPALARADFMAAPCNQMALGMVDLWPEWPEGRLLVHGPAAAGKSHLAAVWAARSGAHMFEAENLTVDIIPKLAERPLVLENIHNLQGDEEQRACFHLMNLARAQGQSILFTSRMAARVLPISLPDLRSRLEAAASVEIHEPDDALLTALLVKLFADKQLRVEPNVITYAAARMERSFASARDLVEILDSEALRRRAKINQAMIRDILQAVET